MNDVICQWNNASFSTLETEVTRMWDMISSPATPTVCL